MAQVPLERFRAAATDLLNNLRTYTKTRSESNGKCLPLNGKSVGTAFGFNFFHPSARFCSKQGSSK